MKLYNRSFQQIMRVSLKLMNFRLPELIEGENSFNELPAILKSRGFNRILIVTDVGIVNAGILQSFIENLETLSINFRVYDKTVPNPTIYNISEALALYHEVQADAIVAVGGGSAIDCAKGVAARAIRPDKSIEQMKGLLKVRKEIPPFYAVPTTAGTGSEATVAAVISNPDTHEKYALMDPVLIPHFAVLDPTLLVKLPSHITSTTGMDALTHAVEAYIGVAGTKEARDYAIEAVKLIYNNLYNSYIEPENLTYRANMQRAAYLAGLAFTRDYVGNVHALAHQLGGFYNVPHGLANAILLPYVLEFYGETAEKRLAELADVIGLAPGQSNKAKASAFIDWIKELNEKMSIPTKIEGIEVKDIPTMAQRANKEANPLYPVPKIMSVKEFAYMYMAVRA